MKIIFTLCIGLCLCAAQDPAVQEFTASNNLFAQSLYKQSTINETGNLLVSPFSAETVLAFVQSGARGATAEEIRRALHLPDDKDKVESALRSLLPKFKSNGLYALHTANKLYVKENLSIKNEFKNAASLVYDAQSESIDFVQNVAAARTINSWVEKHTNNKITNLIDADDLDDATRAVLINALYFKANWSSPFPLAATSKRDFYATPNRAVQVDTLQQFQENFNYYDSSELEAEFVELPFRGGEAVMVVALPKAKDGLTKLEQHIDRVLDVGHPMRKELLNVALPKFRIESLIDFNQVLKKLGVVRVFDERLADLSGISGDQGDLFIDKVTQKTFIDVSEEGVEAAAATLVLVAVPISAPQLTPNPRDFIADHPFIFYIKVKDLIIFAGRVTNPEA